MKTGKQFEDIKQLKVVLYDERREYNQIIEARLLRLTFKLKSSLILFSITIHLKANLSAQKSRSTSVIMITEVYNMMFERT